MTTPAPDRAGLRPGERLAIAERDLAPTALAAAAGAWRDRFTALGLQPGDTLALQARPTAELLHATWAAWRLGLRVAFISTRDPEPLALRKIRLVGARVTLFDRDLVPPPAPPPTVPGPHAPLTAAAPATVIFTSGSTGEPKGVAHTHAAHLANARGANANLPLGPDARWLVSLPLFHVGGLAILYRCQLAGATPVLPDWEADLAANLARGRATHVSLVPTQLRRLLDSGDRGWAAHLQAVLLGGGPIPPDLVRQARAAGVPVLTTYGCTEAASQITTTAPGDPESAFTTAGRPLLDRELRIAPADGEILVRGPMLGSAYLTATGSEPLTDPDGWYHTGDSGHIDADGRLVIHGRIGTRFISGGENIQPEAIERALLAQPRIHAACVVPRPDRDYGMRPVAFVDGAVDEAALAAQLPRFMLPDAIYPWPPELRGLKPDRARLTALARTLAGRHQ